MSDSGAYVPGTERRTDTSRRGDAMSSQQQTQEIIRQLSDMFSPRLKEIQDKLDTLVTRREHEKDLADVSADIGALQRDRDRMQDWADKRPRESADANWVKRIEMDVQSINNRLAQQPAETRAWFNTANSGLGTLIAIVALLLSLLLGLLPHLSFH